MPKSPRKDLTPKKYQETPGVDDIELKDQNGEKMQAKKEGKFLTYKYEAKKKHIPAVESYGSKHSTEEVPQPIINDP